MDKYFSIIAEELGEMESRLKMALQDSSVSILHDISENLIQSGGKRLRPALYLLCSKSDAQNESERISIAAVLELIHTATLLHDDILDDANVRRGLPAVHARWGRYNAVLTGDYVFAKAFFVLAQTPLNNALLTVITDTICKICEGEMLQTAAEFDMSINEQRYLEIISRKTAHFFAACCQMGAMSAAYDSSTAAALNSYGYRLGMAFQIIDDMLDVTASAHTIGKPTLHDLVQGNINLPVIYALQHDRTMFLRNILQQKDFSEKNLRQCAQMVVNIGGIAYCREVAEQFIHLACQVIPKELPIDIREALREIAYRVLGSTEKFAGSFSIGELDSNCGN